MIDTPKIVKFGDVVRNANLVERDALEAGIERVVGLEHLESNNLHIRTWQSFQQGTSFTRKFVKGQTLFGKRRAYQRKVAFAEFTGICSGDLLTFESKDSSVLLPELLPFICQSTVFFDYALNTSAGSLSPRTSWSALQDFTFELPPLAEQKQIAELLWSADDMLVSIENSIDAFETYIRSEIESRLATFCGQSKPLPKLLLGSPESGCSAPPTAAETGHWVLSLAALTRNGYRRGNLKPVAPTPSMLSARLNKGDVLISRSNTIDLVGFAGIFDEDRADVSFPDTMMRLPVNQSLVLPEYLVAVLLSSRGRKHMMRTASGTSNSMKKINRQTLSEFLIPVPELQSQAEFVDNLSSLKSRLALLHEHLERSRILFTLLRDQRITAAHVQ